MNPIHLLRILRQKLEYLGEYCTDFKNADMFGKPSKFRSRWNGCDRDARSIGRKRGKKVEKSKIELKTTSCWGDQLSRVNGKLGDLDSRFQEWFWALKAQGS